ncbi:MAG: hypothetical protein R3C05_22840, partial [Pirellulaceae bacterium]
AWQHWVGWCVWILVQAVGTQLSRQNGRHHRGRAKESTIAKPLGSRPSVDVIVTRVFTGINSGARKVLISFDELSATNRVFEHCFDVLVRERKFDLTTTSRIGGQQLAATKHQHDRRYR